MSCIHGSADAHVLATERLAIFFLLVTDMSALELLQKLQPARLTVRIRKQTWAVHDRRTESRIALLQAFSAFEGSTPSGNTGRTGSMPSVSPSSSSAPILESPSMIQRAFSESMWDY